MCASVCVNWDEIGQWDFMHFGKNLFFDGGGEGKGEFPKIENKDSSVPGCPSLLP